MGLSLAVAFLAFPAFASSSSTTTSTSSTSSSGGHFHFGAGPLRRLASFLGNHVGPFGGFGQSQAVSFTTGQAITVTSTAGQYFVVGTQGKTNGTASGTITFTVEGKLTAGYVVGLTGSLTVNGTLYKVASGSGTMGPGGANILASGTTTSGTYILRASASGNFSGTTTAKVSVDLASGSTEYVVSLTGTIQS